MKKLQNNKLIKKILENKFAQKILTKEIMLYTIFGILTTILYNDYFFPH